MKNFPIVQYSSTKEFKITFKNWYQLEKKYNKTNLKKLFGCIKKDLYKLYACDYSTNYSCTIPNENKLNKDVEAIYYSDFFAK
jgi:hypothetical protein